MSQKQLQFIKPKMSTNEGVSNILSTETVLSAYLHESWKIYRFALVNHLWHDKILVISLLKQ